MKLMKYLIVLSLIVLVGAALGIAAYLAPPRFWRVASIPLYAASLALLAFTVLFSGSGMAPVINGSSRCWITTGIS